MNETMNTVYKNHVNGVSTLLFFYYAGHGACDNNTYIILGDGSTFPLERSLRTISKMIGSYVIGLFDCCREKIPEGEWRGTGNFVNLDALMD